MPSKAWKELPFEVWDKICELLPVRDLKSLRRTFKDSEKSTIKTIFEIAYLGAYNYSVDNFVKICQHEALRKHVRHIVLCPDSIDVTYLHGHGYPHLGEIVEHSINIIEACEGLIPRSAEARTLLADYVERESSADARRLDSCQATDRTIDILEGLMYSRQRRYDLDDCGLETARDKIATAIQSLPNIDIHIWGHRFGPEVCYGLDYMPLPSPVGLRVFRMLQVLPFSTINVYKSNPQGPEFAHVLLPSFISDGLTRPLAENGLEFVKDALHQVERLKSTYSSGCYKYGRAKWEIPIDMIVYPHGYKGEVEWLPSEENDDNLNYEQFESRYSLAQPTAAPKLACLEYSAADTNAGIYPLKHLVAPSLKKLTLSHVKNIVEKDLVKMLATARKTLVVFELTDVELDYMHRRTLPHGVKSEKDYQRWRKIFEKISTIGLKAPTNRDRDGDCSLHVEELSPCNHKDDCCHDCRRIYTDGSWQQELKVSVFEGGQVPSFDPIDYDLNRALAARNDWGDGYDEILDNDAFSCRCHFNPQAGDGHVPDVPVYPLSILPTHPEHYDRNHLNRLKRAHGLASGRIDFKPA